MKSSDHAITVVPLGTAEEVWQDFLARSTNGTLFHDLEFLRYHPEGRFRFHHLMLMRNGMPVALCPGGLAGPDERPLFCSPLGASIGGLVVGAELHADLSLAMVKALQNYTLEQGWAGIQMTLPPNYYSFETTDLIEFALVSQGFRLKHQWLCPVLQLDPEPDDFERKFMARQSLTVRAARRSGVSGIETGIDGLQNFLVPFRDTYTRHGVKATHSEDEIRDLLTRIPDRVRIHLAMLDDVPISSLLIFRVTKTIAYTFYICRTSRHLNAHGPAFLIADTMDRLSAGGLRYLDLGPSASDQKFNVGVTFFKEGLGAIGQCRDQWRWDVNT